MKYGEQHGRWIGDSAGYSANHKRVVAARGEPKECSKCGLKDPSRTYHWANLTGHYSDAKDYARMCVPCHRKYDYARAKALNPHALNHKFCYQGHEMKPENLLVCGGVRRCKTCHLERCKEWKRQWRRSLGIKPRAFLAEHLRQP